MQSQTEPSDTSTKDGAISDAKPRAIDQSELVDQLKRALADSDNLRKSLQRTAEDDRRFAVRLLATERMLRDALEKVGVCRIEAMGASFDSHLHEAIAEIHESDVETGHIADVLEDSCRFHKVADRHFSKSRTVIAADLDRFS